MKNCCGGFYGSVIIISFIISEVLSACVVIIKLLLKEKPCKQGYRKLKILMEVIKLNKCLNKDSEEFYRIPE